MIILDKDKCTGCGLCVEICHEHCMALVNDTVRINYEFCSTCTQCIAICPQQALSWDHVPPVAYDDARLPSPKQLDELFKERRTIRFFKEGKIDRTLLEEIVRYGIYAPTHSFSFRAIVVDEEEIIELVNKVLMRFISRLYNLLYKRKIIHSLIRRLAPAYEAEYVKAKPKLESALARGHALGSPPVAIVFVVGDKRIPLSEASAQYILYNMNLYAQVKGVGGRNLVGNQMFLNRNKAIWKRLGLEKHERIFGTLGLGYPAVKFRNKVEGKTLPIQWNDDGENCIEN
jgi:NAD-dependent dihydropyrimidine dehydrogenase PreA subunit/nitroreductase